MRPLIFDYLFKDDRMFVLEISPVDSDDAEAVVLVPGARRSRSGAWAVVTRRNVPGYPAHRVDRFASNLETEAFYKRTVVSTPRKSLGERSPEPEPTLAEYIAWLQAENLFDPLLNPRGKRADA